MFLEIGKIRQVTPSEIWGDQAQEFVSWLAGNLDSVGPVLNIELEVDDRRLDDGGAGLSLIAHDRKDPSQKFLIGCWLSSDQAPSMEELLDQADKSGVQTLIWVSPEFSDVQLRVLEWLNKHIRSMRFYALGMNLLQIGDSAPALEWKLCHDPDQPEPVSEAPPAFDNSPDQKRQETAAFPAAPPPLPPETIHRQFLEGVAEELRTKHGFASEDLLVPYNVLTLPSGRDGVSYQCVIMEDWNICTQIHIDTASSPGNEWIFNTLKCRQPELEAVFGQILTWEKEENKGYGQISLYRRSYALGLQETHVDICDWCVSRLISFRESFHDYIVQLSAQLDSLSDSPTHWRADAEFTDTPAPEPESEEEIINGGNPEWTQSIELRPRMNASDERIFGKASNLQERPIAETTQEQAVVELSRTQAAMDDLSWKPENTNSEQVFFSGSGLELNLNAVLSRDKKAKG